MLSTAEILDAPDVVSNAQWEVDRMLLTATDATDVGVGGWAGALSYCSVRLEVIIESVEDTLRIAPPKRDHNDPQLFLLNRALLTLELNTGEEFSTSARTKVFNRWHSIGLETNQLDPAKTRDDYRAMFFSKTAKVIVPLGRTLDWSALIEELHRRPLPSPDIYESKEIRRLIVLCELLQEFWGAAPFFLPCRKAGEVIGVGHTTANIYLNALLGAKVLSLAFKGGFIKGKKVASRYRFNAKEINTPT